VFPAGVIPQGTTVEVELANSPDVDSCNWAIFANVSLLCEGPSLFAAHWGHHHPTPPPLLVLAGTLAPTKSPRPTTRAPSVSPTTTYVPLRLVGGSMSWEGRVEVLYNGQWGTVCDDAFGADDADVVCRQLGFGAAVAWGNGDFGQGSDPIWLNNLGCNGHEAALELCPHRGAGGSRTVGTRRHVPGHPGADPGLENLLCTTSPQENPSPNRLPPFPQT